MSDKHTKWLSDAIVDGLSEWAAVRASESQPEPEEHEKAIYRLAFTAGADAALQHVSEILTREE